MAQKREGKIAVAFDVPTLKEALYMADLVGPHVDYLKIGLELITGVGMPALMEAFKGRLGQLFVDNKFSDIPNTNGAAARILSQHGVGMFNVMANSGVESMRAVVANKGTSKVVAVTVLTSIDEEECHSMFGGPTKVRVLQWSRNALLAGVDCILCSPRELSVLRKRPEFKDIPIITPGIRSKEDAPDDQKRTMTAGEAIKAGADILVIGRPITKASEPAEAAKRFAEEIKEAQTTLAA